MKNHYTLLEKQEKIHYKGSQQLNKTNKVNSQYVFQTLKLTGQSGHANSL
ncbi:hypothetical protein M153_7390004340 [Pseudoloma neurophilia]|uniref:Uncharacterized protein n=1 Tax=Pseudoloma neurophilia TaxID=146866 RepID=A0A0R0M3G7_9MICR|nr:hypothetical protein M153_7390004340 [Pseudoloma neurophilia]